MLPRRPGTVGRPRHFQLTGLLPRGGDFPFRVSGRTAAVLAPPRLAGPGSRRVTPIPLMRGRDRCECLVQGPLVLSVPVRPAGWGATPRRAYAAGTVGLWAL